MATITACSDTTPKISKKKNDCPQLFSCKDFTFRVSIEYFTNIVVSNSKCFFVNHEMTYFYRNETFLSYFLFFVGRNLFFLCSLQCYRYKKPTLLKRNNNKKCVRLRYFRYIGHQFFQIFFLFNLLKPYPSLSCNLLLK